MPDNDNNTSKRYRINEAVYATETEQGMIVLHMHQGEYFELNDTATLIFQCLQRGQSMLAAAQELCTEFDCSMDNALSDVSATVAELLHIKLIEPV